MEKLFVSEIFASIQGEGTRAGMPCAFVRLSGCNLRCRYCDTEYARESGREMTVGNVMKRVLSFRLPLVEVTGGEPLLQPACRTLLKRLRAEGLTTLLETNGTIDLSAVCPGVIRIVDIKCPSSSESNSMLWSNIRLLTGQDEVKFVIADRRDYDWALEVIKREKLSGRCSLLLSPVWGELDPGKLAQWMVTDSVPARLQLQLHKIIWNSERGK